MSVKYFCDKCGKQCPSGSGFELRTHVADLYIGDKTRTGNICRLCLRELLQWFSTKEPDLQQRITDLENELEISNP